VVPVYSRQVGSVYSRQVVSVSSRQVFTVYYILSVYCLDKYTEPCYLSPQLAAIMNETRV